MNLRVVVVHPAPGQDPGEIWKHGLFSLPQDRNPRGSPPRATGATNSTRPPPPPPPSGPPPSSPFAPVFGRDPSTPLGLPMLPLTIEPDAPMRSRVTRDIVSRFDHDCNACFKRSDQFPRCRAEGEVGDTWMGGCGCK